MLSIITTECANANWRTVFTRRLEPQNSDRANSRLVVKEGMLSEGIMYTN